MFELTYDMGGPTVRERFQSEDHAIDRAMKVWVFGLDNIQVKRMAGDRGYVIWRPPEEE